jgi:metal-responsive CopG/Arc/MetJ family transcriptional regulator
MKTAISIPDPLFQAAELLAQEQGISRSELYSTAIRDYVAQHKNQKVTEALNVIYSVQKNSLDSNLDTLQTQSTSKEEW